MGPRREPAGSLPVLTGPVEILDRRPEDRDVPAPEFVGQIVGERSRARSGGAVDRDDRPAVPVVVQDLIGQRPQLVLLLRCPSSHTAIVFARPVGWTDGPRRRRQPMVRREQARPARGGCPGSARGASWSARSCCSRRRSRRVVPRLEEWLARWPTPADLAAAPAGRSGAGVGTARLPAASAVAARLRRRDHRASRRRRPRLARALLALPGIGDYTARAVAVFAYGQRHPVVDANVRRVLARAVGGQAEAGPPSTRATWPR